MILKNIHMEGMIEHHMMAVMMAEMCVEKAVHEELRMTCEEIIATQTQEMMMQAWLQDWYGISYEPQMTTGMMMQGWLCEWYGICKDYLKA